MSKGGSISCKRLFKLNSACFYNHGGYDFAKKFYADAYRASALESAKSYREKKAKPLWNKLVTFLRSLYRSYLDLKEHYNNLLQRYNRQCIRTDDLCDRIAELTEQNKQLTAQNNQSTQALETLKQAFGEDKVESVLESSKFAICQDKQDQLSLYAIQHRRSHQNQR